MKIFLALLATILIVETAFVASADAQAGALVGMPPLDHAWNGDDYQHAANALETTREPLPGSTDGQGQKLLQRLTTTENLAPYKDHTEPLEQRVAGCYATCHAISSIYVLYAKAARKGTNLHHEAAELLAFMLRAEAISFLTVAFCWMVRL